MFVVQVVVDIVEVDIVEVAYNNSVAVDRKKKQHSVELF